MPVGVTTAAADSGPAAADSGPAAVASGAAAVASGAAAVAAGNADTASAAVEVLRAGGNAYDAAVAAGFAAAVTEPGLSSLGGGGFLLARTADGAATVYDFFVDAPGRGRAQSELEPSFTPVTVRFAGADQVFHAGSGSVAAPGCLAGYLHVHERLGRLPLADVVAPAARMARDGVALDAMQATVLVLLEQIVTLGPVGRRLYAPHGVLLRTGATMRNPELADLLDDIGAGRVRGFDDAGLAGPLADAMDADGGLLTAADLDAYTVLEREPLGLTYRGVDVLTNPQPSFGGTIVAEGIATLGGGDRLDGSVDAAERLAGVIVGMSERHAATPQAVRGTTHVSVVDGDGNVATMTTSNGSCSGIFIPGTGVQLNNVMGESDLHPQGFHVTQPGTRIGSMMAPTVLTLPDGAVVALGSGGSERIRSALVCVVTALVDRGLPLVEAVAAARLHWDRSVLQLEPGWAPEMVERLGRSWPVSVWRSRDLYFGGVNTVARSAAGRVTAAGDPRRGGVGVVVDS